MKTNSKPAANVAAPQNTANVQVINTAIVDTLQSAKAPTATAKAAAKASTKKTLTVCTIYIDRVRFNKSLCTESPKIAFKLMHDYSIIPADLLALTADGAGFKSYLAYMKKRHNIPANDTTTAPRHGWSIWYACQWAESQVKAAAADEKHPAHKAAKKYLLLTKIERQNEAAKKAIF